MSKIEKLYGLGTYWWFDFFDDPTNLSEIELFISSEIRDFEQRYSRFIETSDLSKLNKTRVLHNPNQEMLVLLKIAKEYYNLSNATFNPAIGAILENRGYDKNYSFKRQGDVENVLDFSKMITVSNDKIELVLDGNLDFGGFGKGYLIDKLGNSLKSGFGLNNFIINGGGDLLVCSQQKKEVLLENPFKPGYSFLNIDLQNQALGCSSNTKRRWKDSNNGQDLVHIINPKALDQISKVGSFVIAKDTLTADILATLVCIHYDNLSEIERLQQLVSFEYLILDENERISSSKGFGR